MKMLQLVSMIAVGLAGCSYAMAQESGIPLPKPELKFAVKDNTKTVQASSVDVLCEDGIYFDKEHVKPVSVLLVQQVKSLTRLQSDGGDDYSLDATAYLGGEDYPKKKLWSVQDDASKGEVLPQFYHTTASGGELLTERYYDLQTGHLVYTTNSELLSVITKGADRFITIHRQYMKDDDFPKGADRNTFAGLILYGDAAHVLKKLIITGPDQDGVPDQPHVELVLQGKIIMEGQLFQDDVPSYEILVTLADATFHIPFDANGPLLDQIKDLPKGFAVKVQAD